VLTTNNQNKISSRDLKANDPIQIDIRAALEPFGYLYEHIQNQYLGTPIPSGKKVVSNENIAQAYLAVILKKPSDARRRKYKIWSEYYGRIFKVASLEQHVLAYEAVVRASDWAKATKKRNGVASLERRMLSSGTPHEHPK
jgi:hypothetical protein